MTDSRCPCGSGNPLADCCLPIIDGMPAPTAERLMRSRFTAFALGRTDHLLSSWDPASRLRTLELDPSIVWRRLQIVDTVDGGAADDTGIVEFRAAHLIDGVPHVLHERSRFRRSDGRWVYVDGVATVEAIGR